MSKKLFWAKTVSVCLDWVIVERYIMLMLCETALLLSIRSD